MPPTIIEGRLADIDGVRRARIAIEGGVIARVGNDLGPPAHTFDDDFLIFAGMGDIHIHAREESRANAQGHSRAAAAALPAEFHVADMPNNPVAPVDDATYAAGKLLKGRICQLCYSLRRYRPPHEPLSSNVPTRRTWAQVSATCIFPRWNNWRRHWPTTPARRSAFIARTRFS